MSSSPDSGRLGQALYETIQAASTQLPADVTTALRNAARAESSLSCASSLNLILENVQMAARKGTPICQDTGFPTFFIEMPRAYDRNRMRELILKALQEATRSSLLRPNAVDILSGRNTGDNTGVGYPAVYFEETDRDVLTLRLLLKGGGSENVSTQYKLPHAPLSAGRDLAGVAKCVLHAVYEAQGYGCGPGILGVAVGSDRAQSYSLAKKQLLRPLSVPSDSLELARLESEITRKANGLGIGAMGFGGDTTVLGTHIAVAHRHPASYFVTVAYGCWALRRKTLEYSERGYEIRD